MHIKHGRDLAVLKSSVYRSNRWARATTRSACLMLSIALTACATSQQITDAKIGGKNQVGFVQLPLIGGWHDGQRVHYITTDASDMAAATKMSANFSPRLTNALPEQPQAPGQRSALERIYAVTNFDQGNVLPSAPGPVGSGSTDKAYSPLWRMFKVTWAAGSTPMTLRSEEEVLAAIERGWVTMAPTDIVVNCPVVNSARGGLLPGATLIGVVD